MSLCRLFPPKPFYLKILTKRIKLVISINQDSFGLAATTFRPTGASAPVAGTLYPYWSGELSDGYVIGLVATSGAATLTVSFSYVPGLGAGAYSWKEAYTGASGTGKSVSATLVEHDMAVFKVAKSGNIATTSGVSSTATSSSTTSTSVAKTTSSSTKATSTGTGLVTATSTTSSSSATSSGGTIPKWGQ